MAKPYKFKKEYSQQLIELMSQGYSAVEVAAKLGCLYEELYRWSNDARFKEFKRAWKLGHQAEEAYWRDIGRRMCNGELRGTAPAYIYNMKCRFKGTWLEDGQSARVTINPDKSDALTEDELNKKLLRLLQKEAVKLEHPIDAVFEEVEISEDNQSNDKTRR